MNVNMSVRLYLAGAWLMMGIICDIMARLIRFCWSPGIGRADLGNLLIVAVLVDFVHDLILYYFM